MSIYLQVLQITAIIVFIVDISGFTEAWRSALGRWLHISIREDIKPWTCSLCMVHHIGVIYALCVQAFSLPVWVFICLCAFMAKPVGQLVVTLRDLLEALVFKVNEITNKLWEKGRN